MPITIATVDNLRRKLDELPPQENVKHEVSKQEAVSLLADEITALQARGYAIDEIAQLLSNNGLPLSVATLKSYLSRARSSSRKPGAKPRKTRRGREVEREVVGAECKSMKEEMASGGTPKAAPQRLESTTGVSSGGFVPREDSIDI